MQAPTDDKFIEERLRFQNYSPATRRQAVRAILDPGKGRRPPVCLCGMPRFADVDVHLGEDAHRAPRARMAGIYKCGNPHVCPDCAVAGAAARAETYRKADDAITAKGGLVLTFTLTLSHDSRFTLSDSLRAINEASRRSRQGRKYEVMARALGCNGILIERHIRYNSEADSWHVHQHGTAFLEAGDKEAAEDFGRLLISRYSELLEERGRRADLSRQWCGVLSPQRSTQYTYPADHDRSPTHETENGDLTHRSWSPFELAERAHESGDQHLFSRFREYAAATKGSRSAILTKAMAEKLGLTRSAPPPASEDTKLGTLPGRVWEKLRHDGNDTQFLRRVESAGRANWPTVRHWAIARAGYALPSSHKACHDLAELLFIRDLVQSETAFSILNDQLTISTNRLFADFGEVARLTVQCVQETYRTYPIDTWSSEIVANQAEEWASKLERKFAA